MGVGPTHYKPYLRVISEVWRWTCEMTLNLTIDKPESKSKVQALSQIENGKRNLDSVLSLKSYDVTQYDPLYLLITKQALRWGLGSCSAYKVDKSM